MDIVTALNHKVVIPEIWEILEVFTDVERTGQIYEKFNDFLENIEKFDTISAIKFDPEIFRMLIGFS
jgi:hypothetical protein